MAAVIARHDWAAPLAKALRGLWTDAYAVGWLSSGAVLAHHLGVVKAEGDVATVTLGVDWGGWAPGDTDAAKQILGRDDALGHLLSLVDTGDAVADSIVVSRMDRLARTLIDGLEQGLAPASIASQLQGILGDARWAHLVALTETTRAVSAATLARYARNGVAAKEWMTAGDQHVCVPCNTNEDVGAIPLDGAFPDGNDAPPGHPLCRCAIAPAFLTAEEAAAAGADLTGLGSAAGFGEADLAGIVTRAAEDILAESGSETAVAAPAIGPTEAELSADPALKMTVAQLKQVAADSGVDLRRAKTKRDIIWQIRQWESDRLKSGGKVLLPDGPIGKPIRFTPEPIVAPPLGVPAAGGKVLSGSALNDWADYFRHDFEQGRFEFVDAAGNTTAEGVRVQDLRIQLGWRSEGIPDYVVGTGTAWRFDGVAYLIEHDPADFGAPWVSRTLQELRDAHEAIPAAVRANKSYAVVLRDSPYDPYWQRKFNNPSHRGAMSAGDGHINIWHFMPRVSRVDVNLLRHETGHNLDSLLASGMHHGTSASREWLTAADKDLLHVNKIKDLQRDTYRSDVAPGFDASRAFAKGVTRYGQSSGAEDFAESVMLYQIGPIARGVAVGEQEARALYFRDLFPERAKILDKAFPDIAKQQKAEIKALREPPKPAAPVDLSRQTVTQLRAEAKARGLTGYSKLTKPQLLDLLGRDVEGAAVSRQVEIDAARNLADTLAEVHELVANEASERALRARITARARLTGVDVTGLLAKVGDREALLAEADRMAAAANLTRVGEVATSQVGPVPFNRKLQELLGPGLREGAPVDIIRPGYTVRLRSGEELAVRRPVVLESTRPLRVEPTSTVTDRAALRAAARERNRQIEAATGTERLLAEVDELLAKKASLDVIRERLAPGLTEPGQMFSGADAKVLAALTRAVDTGDVTKVRAAVTRQSTAAKLKIEAKAGTKVTFDPALHESVGGVDIPAGTKVVVVRRGASVTLPDGTVLELTKPQVRTTAEPVRQS